MRFRGFATVELYIALKECTAEIKRAPRFDRRCCRRPSSSAPTLRQPACALQRGWRRWRRSTPHGARWLPPLWPPSRCAAGARNPFQMGVCGRAVRVGWVRAGMQLGNDNRQNAATLSAVSVCLTALVRLLFNLSALEGKIPGCSTSLSTEFMGSGWTSTVRATVHTFIQYGVFVQAKFEKQLWRERQTNAALAEQLAAAKSIASHAEQKLKVK